ncbi:uncharacterized protein LOC105664020 isoform X3 [Megachile rotundata]|uniref:uncharacterized protein LOC105664020 isoform X3 n=1 Tax=Megachile rotundata TaxID=143995 RepID=UPI000614EB8D|nr:PREDICTED: uncharacterized protein LOC105664020 isoform X2 [Megachile rotundata]
MENYRPISLLPNIGKLFEIIINNGINNFVSVNNLLPQQQFGFRLSRSTVHAINKLATDICWSLNESKPNLMRVFPSQHLRALSNELPSSAGSLKQMAKSIRGSKYSLGPVTLDKIQCLKDVRRLPLNSTKVCIKEAEDRRTAGDSTRATGGFK